MLILSLSLSCLTLVWFRTLRGIRRFFSESSSDKLDAIDVFYTLSSSATTDRRDINDTFSEVKDNQIRSEIEILDTIRALPSIGERQRVRSFSSNMSRFILNVSRAGRRQLEEGLRPRVFREVGVSNLIFNLPMANGTPTAELVAYRIARIQERALSQIRSVPATLLQRKAILPRVYDSEDAEKWYHRTSSYFPIVHFVQSVMRSCDGVLLVGSSLISDVSILDVGPIVDSISFIAALSFHVERDLVLESESELPRPPLDHIPRELWRYAIYNSSAEAGTEKERRANVKNYYFLGIPLVGKEALGLTDRSYFSLVDTTLFLGSIGYYSGRTSLVFLEFLASTDQLYYCSRYAASSPLVQESIGLTSYELELEKRMNHLVHFWQRVVVEAQEKIYQYTRYVFCLRSYEAGKESVKGLLLHLEEEIRSTFYDYVENLALTKMALQTDFPNVTFLSDPDIARVDGGMDTSFAFENYQRSVLSWSENWYG